MLVFDLVSCHERLIHKSQHEVNVVEFNLASCDAVKSKIAQCAFWHVKVKHVIMACTIEMMLERRF